MSNRYLLASITILVLLVNLSLAWQVYAGAPNPPTVPSATNSYNLEDIYNRLNTGVAATQSTFTEPSSAPGVGTMHTLNEIYDLIGMRAPVPKTGIDDLDNYLELPGEDGHADMRKGVAWPNPRFTDNGNGTVTDNLTGLIWLKNAHCTRFFYTDPTGQIYRNWYKALEAANSLTNGYCGLSDGSSAGDWRLPNIRELHSLIDYGVYTPAVPDTAGTGHWTHGHPFYSVQPQLYWSSSTHAHTNANAWLVGMNDGQVTNAPKINDAYVWAVRGGQ